MTAENPLLSTEILDIVPVAAQNYIESLRLPQSGPVLFITDTESMNDPNVAARRELSNSIEGLARSDKHKTLRLEFNEESTYEEMYAQVTSAMRVLEETNDEEQRITVVYIGGQWTQRYGMYNAVAEHSENVRQARIAISPQVNLSDVEVMSRITSDKLAQIGKAMDYFERFFEENPKGTFIIKTEKDGVEGELKVNFDTSKAPYAHDKGVLDDENPNPIDTGKGIIFNGGNVLGAESYGSPYPFEESHGTFVTKEGIKITVENGYMTAAENWQEVYEALEDKQRRIIDILNERAKAKSEGGDFEYLKVALSEIGLGAFRIAGVDDIPTSCSTVIAEKLGPHAGGGKAPGVTSEKEKFDDAAEKVGFGHTDFVMPTNTTITFISEEGEESQFYPPVSLD